MPPNAVIESGVYGGAALASRYYPAPVGVIEPGAYADLIFVDYHPTTPLTTENLAGHIIYGFDESMVSTTIVNGEVLMRAWKHPPVPGTDQQHYGDEDIFLTPVLIRTAAARRTTWW